MSGCRGNVEAPPVWWGYCCRVGLSPVALRGLRGRWFCILSKSRTAAQHGGRFRLLSGGAGAGSLRDGLPWAVGRRVRHIMTWAGNLHRWPRRSSPSLPSSPPLDSLTGSLRALGLGWIGSAARSPAGRGWSAGRGWRLVVGLVRLWRRLACSAPAPSFLLSRWPASLPVRARAAPRCRLALLLLACGVALPSQVGRLGAGLA